MESSVASQISPTTYSADVFKLHPDDIDFESELFEINIFNTILHIAPGKSIGGDDGLVYFYVYAIKDERVIANLGVYELITDEQKLIYDISTFENLLLFDYYYTNQGKIKEFEITAKNNIFDYINTHLEVEKDKKRLVNIFNEFRTYITAEKDALGDNYKLYHAVLSIISKEIKTTGITKDTLDKLKEKCDTERKKPLEQFKICLAILEPFYNVHFLLIDNGETVTNFRDKTPSEIQKFKPTQYIIVSTDQSFVSTSSTFKEPEVEEDIEVPEVKDKDELEGELEEGEIVEDLVEAESKDEASDGGEAKLKETSRESEDSTKSKPKISRPTPKLPKVSKSVAESKDAAELKESKKKVKLTTISEANGSVESETVKPEKKAKVRSLSSVSETKLEPKSQAVESKPDAKSEPKVRVLKSSKESKPEAKSQAKEAASESKEVKESKDSKPRSLKSKPKP